MSFVGASGRCPWVAALGQGLPRAKVVWTWPSTPIKRARITWSCLSFLARLRIHQLCYFHRIYMDIWWFMYVWSVMGYRSEWYEAYQCLKGLKGLPVYPFQLVGLATWVLVTPRPWSLYLWTLPTFSQRISHQLGGAMSKPSCWGSRWRQEKGRITDHQKHFLFLYKKISKRQ